MEWAAQEGFRDNEIYRNQFMLLAPASPSKVIKSWFTLGLGGIRKQKIKKLLKTSGNTTEPAPKRCGIGRANSISQTPAQKQTLHAGEVISIAEEPPRKF